MNKNLVVIDKEKLAKLPGGKIWLRRLSHLIDFYTKHVKDGYIEVESNPLKGQEDVK